MFSQQNTFTGRLTPAMLESVLTEAKDAAASELRPPLPLPFAEQRHRSGEVLQLRVFAARPSIGGLDFAVIMTAK